MVNLQSSAFSSWGQCGESATGRMGGVVEWQRVDLKQHCPFANQVQPENQLVRFATLRCSFGPAFAIRVHRPRCRFAKPSNKKKYIMQVAGIGMGGMGGGAAGLSPVAGGAPAAVNGAGQPGNVSAGTSPAAAQGLSPGMQSLVETLQDFSSAEILIALMLMSASERCDDDKHCGGGSGAALGLLAGLALASQLGNAAGMNSQSFGNFADAAGGGITGAIGIGIDVSV